MSVVLVCPEAFCGEVVLTSDCFTPEMPQEPARTTAPRFNVSDPVMLALLRRQQDYYDGGPSD